MTTLAKIAIGILIAYLLIGVAVFALAISAQMDVNGNVPSLGIIVVWPLEIAPIATKMAIVNQYGSGL